MKHFSLKKWFVEKLIKFPSPGTTKNIQKKSKIWRRKTRPKKAFAKNLILKFVFFSLPFTCEIKFKIIPVNEKELL